MCWRAVKQYSVINSVHFVTHRKVSALLTLSIFYLGGQEEVFDKFNSTVLGFYCTWFLHKASLILTKNLDFLTVYDCQVSRFRILLALSYVLYHLSQLSAPGMRSYFQSFTIHYCILLTWTLLCRCAIKHHTYSKKLTAVLANESGQCVLGKYQKDCIDMCAIEVHHSTLMI